jgi:malate dehydrogenase
MQEVAIVGAGGLGGAVAHALAQCDAVRAITLIDDVAGAAAGKALDIAQAAPVDGFTTRIRGTADLSAVAGTAVVVIADRFGKEEWQSEDGLMLLKRMKQLASTAVILCAGAAQRELVDRGVCELEMARHRLFGSAPEALAGGARALVALSLNASPRDVALAVLGVPPSQVVIPWNDATVAGFEISRVLDEPTRRRLGARVAALWPPGPQALAAAAVSAIASMAGKSRRLASCFIAPDTSTGLRTRTAAMPARLGPAGIVDILVPSLSVAEQVALDNAMGL